MKVVDIATCIGPGKPHREVGIRPGEKLHEVMVPGAMPAAVELEDRFVMLPAFTDGPYKDWTSAVANPSIGSLCQRQQRRMADRGRSLEDA